MAIEGAEARHLALHGRRRYGPALPSLAGAELGNELGQLGVRDLERRVAVPLQPDPELLEVGAVGLERVARQAPLELEVREEVEDEIAERTRRGMRRGGGHRPSRSARASALLGRASRRSAADA